MIVQGQGPRPATLMVVGEQPGEREAESGVPFDPHAPVGRELRRYLAQVVEIGRNNVFFTNLVRDYKKDRDLKPEDIAKWAPALEEELATVKPKVIISLGREPTRHFLGDVNLEDVYALPHRWRNGTIVVPNYLRLYDSDLQPVIWYGFLQTRRILRGEIQPYERTKLRKKDFTYCRARNSVDVHEYLKVAPERIAVDTEGLPGKPWGLSFSIAKQLAHVIRVRETDALVAFKDAIRKSCVILHNSLHDLAVLRDMGIELKDFDDTMVMAFLLCLEPLGLKSLAYRFRGIQRESYEEVVGPTANRLAEDWLEEIVQESYWEAIDTTRSKPTQWSIVRRIEHILGGYYGNIMYGGELTKKAMAAKKKELIAAGVAGKMNYNVKDFWGWEHCLADRPTMSRLQDIADICPLLTRRDGAKDPARRWKSVCKEHPEQTDIVENVFHESMPEPGLDTVEEVFKEKGVEHATLYSAGDADDTWTIYPILWKQIQDLHLEPVYRLDMSVIPMIDRMMEVGFRVDREYLQDLGEQIGAEMNHVLAEIRQITGRPLNPNSSLQVAEYLFDELELPVQHFTETHQRSTADDVIESLRLVSNHPILPLISDYRELNKMKGTYADKLWRWLKRGDDRIHPRLRITRVPSGRLACSEPNLMAIPVRSQRMLGDKKLGVAIRDGFIPGPGHLLGSWDLDQIEMRVLADLSQDENLVRVFKSGEDIHRRTASLVFNIPIDQVQDWQRSSAKAVGFGIVYGQTAKGLQLQMKLRGIDRPEAECQAMIDSYLRDAYPGVKRLMEEKQREGRQCGYVRSSLGRIRYLPALHSRNMRLRSESDRICLNHTVQTTAQEILKYAMAGIWVNVLPAIWREGWYCQPVLQIHDEILLEFDERIGGELDALVRAELENAVRLCIPIGSKSHYAQTWGGLK